MIDQMRITKHNYNKIDAFDVTLRVYRQSLPVVDIHSE